MKFTFTIAAFLSLILILSCRRKDDYNSRTVEPNGFAPVYVDSVAYMKAVLMLEPRAIQEFGETIVKDDTLLIVNDPFVGVHFLTQKDSGVAAEPGYFLNAPYTQHIDLQGNVLYLQSALGVLCIDIANYPSIKIIGNKPQNDTLIIPKPPLTLVNHGGGNGWIYIDCIDLTKGKLMAWKLEKLDNPKCMIKLQEWQ